jgi:hypothetical protein
VVAVPSQHRHQRAAANDFMLAKLLAVIGGELRALGDKF